MAVNIMIADDHSMIREGLKQLLELDGDIKVIAEANNGKDCLEKLNTYHPDVLLLAADLTFTEKGQSTPGAGRADAGSKAAALV